MPDHTTLYYTLTVTEALDELCKKIGLKDPRGWAVFITYNNISRGLGEKERLAGMSPTLCDHPRHSHFTHEHD
jgi:hypothetical protein